MRAAALLLPALLLGGCTGVSIEGLQRADLPREPHYEEHRGLVAPQHNQTYPLPVEAGARLVNASLHLVPRASGILLPGVSNAPAEAPGPAAAPARLDLDLLDPSGRLVATAQVDPALPNATLLLPSPAPPGEWTARVRGAGAAGRVDGEDYGAAYLLTLEVLYG